MAVAIVIVLAFPAYLHAQSLDSRLEACNGITDSKLRLDCLKAATSEPSTSSTATERNPGAPEALTVGRAAAICERFLGKLKPKHDLASEVSAKTTDSELAVTWPPDEGKAPTICMVNRSTGKIAAIESNGRVLPGSVVAQMEQGAEFRQEIRDGKYDSFVRFAKEALTRSFKDPGSAEFRGLFISGKSLSTLCGEVNGKNSYGAFVGFHRFYTTGDATLTMIESTQNAPVFGQMWPSMCGDKVADIVEQ